MQENTSPELKQETDAVPFSNIVYKSVIILFFCIAFSSYLFGYLFTVMTDMLKSTDFILSHKATTSPHTVKAVFSMLMGIFFAVPFISTYFLSYKSPAVYASHKKRFFFLATVASIISIFGMSAFVWGFIPALLDFSKRFLPPSNAVIVPANDYIYSMVPLIIGIGLFAALPVVTYIFDKADVSGKMKSSLSVPAIIVLTLIVAAIVTPPDPVSMILMAVIYIALYTISALTTRFA